MTEPAPSLCDDAEMQAILAVAQGDGDLGVGRIDDALRHYPDDPRLHFLRGSLLIGAHRFIEAHAAMSRAVAIAPDYAIARFQLGFFELTSGEAEAAIETWRPLDALPEGHYLRRFVAGLEHLIADRFAPCIAELSAGIAVNDENPPLDRDMELIIARCRALLDEHAPPPDEPAEISSTSFLLGMGKA